MLLHLIFLQVLSMIIGAMTILILQKASLLSGEILP